MLFGKTLIIGDSYSTFEGHIPKGYDAWFNEERIKMGETNVSNVEQTWWYPLFDGKNNILLRNDSYSGTTICNTVRPEHNISASFINRFDKLIKDGFFKENQVDTILIFGGTNDSWIDCPVGENQFCDFKPDDLFNVLPACGYLAKRISEIIPKIRTCWLINTDLKECITNGIINNAKHFGQETICFSQIYKQSCHPSIEGMKQIFYTVQKHFQYKSE